jgi:hypothetical protein
MLILLLVVVTLTAVAEDPGFECTITSDRTNYTVGEVPKFTFRIINKSGKEVMLVGCLDGSDTNRRSPRCDLEILDARGKPVKETILVCGNMNLLRTKDFVPVPAGEAFDPCGQDFSSLLQLYKFPVKAPGEYTFRFYYSTSDRIQDYLGDERTSGKPLDPEITRLFKRVPKLDLKSNALKLKFSGKGG